MATSIEIVAKRELTADFLRMNADQEPRDGKADDGDDAR
jgi:hypothetical protein